MVGSEDDIPPPPPPPQTPTQQTPHTVSTIKLPILKKGEYDIWAMKWEHYLRPYRTIYLGKDHLAKFHKMTDGKEMWEAIKSRFGGNDESKKMQNLLSQLEIHGAGISTEDANKKFLRSLHSAWSQVSLIMRTNPGVDGLSFDDLYNNLRVFESDVKGSTASSYSTQNVAFVSENTSSTNDVSTAYGASSSSLEMGFEMAGGNNFHRLKSSTTKRQVKATILCKETVGFDKQSRVLLVVTRTRHFVESADPNESSQMSARDKAGLGYGDQMNKGVLSYENEVFQSVFVSKTSDIEDSPGMIDMREDACIPLQ
ncbi:hypothetical protein Tco_0431128 [Tanacetum coccineum]